MPNRGDWGDINKRREYLLAFAAKIGFDPMKKANWRGMGVRMQLNKVSLPIPIVYI